MLGQHESHTLDLTYEQHLALLKGPTAILASIVFFPLVILSIFTLKLGVPNAKKPFLVMSFHIFLGAAMAAVNIFGVSVLLCKAVVERMVFAFPTITAVLSLLVLAVVSMMVMARVYSCYSLSDVMPVYYTLLTIFVFILDIFYNPDALQMSSVYIAVAAATLILPAFLVLKVNHDSSLIVFSDEAYCWS